MPTGYETFFATCRTCGHKAELRAGNELVGCQERMRCSSCNHRGADLLRVWHVVSDRELGNVTPIKKGAGPEGPAQHIPPDID